MKCSFILFFLVVFFSGLVLADANLSLDNLDYNDKVVGGQFVVSFSTSINQTLVNCSCDYFIDDEENASFFDYGFEHSLSRSFDEGEHEMKIFCVDGNYSNSTTIDFVFIDLLSWDLTDPDERDVEKDYFDLKFKTSKDVVCRYSNDEDDDFVYMDALDITDGTSHKLEVSGLEAGRITFYFGCVDNFGEIFYNGFNFRVDLKKPVISVEPHYADYGEYSEYVFEYVVEDDLDVKSCDFYSNIFGKFERNDYSKDIVNGDVNFFILNNVNFSEDSYVFEIRCKDYLNNVASSGNRTLRVLSDDLESVNDIRDVNEVIELGGKNEDSSGEEVSKSKITGSVIGGNADFVFSDYFYYFVLTLFGVLGFLLINKFSLKHKDMGKSSVVRKKGKSFSRRELIDSFDIALFRERRKMKLSVKQVANKIGFDEKDILDLEDGVIPNNNSELINKLEDFYGINLKRYK